MAPAAPLLLFCLCATAAAGRAGQPEYLRPGWQARRRRSTSPLSPEQLSDIYSIECLHAKQKDPSADCGTTSSAPPAAAPAPATPTTRPASHYGIGNYPDWREARCRSGGEFFCDPDGLLDANESAAVRAELRRFRRQASVRCKNSGCCDPDNKITDSPFYLALAVADEWPESELDPASLQKFGLVLLGQWGLMPTYNGVATNNADSGMPDWFQNTEECPNTAVLVLLPRYHTAFLASGSCQFICAERGGEEVVAVTEAAGGLVRGVEAGLAVARRFLEVAGPLSERRTDVEHRRLERDRRHLVAAVRQDAFLIALQRGILALGLAVSLIGAAAFVYYNLVPLPLYQPRLQREGPPDWQEYLPGGAKRTAGEPPVQTWRQQGHAGHSHSVARRFGLRWAEGWR